MSVDDAAGARLGLGLFARIPVMEGEEEEEEEEEEVEEEERIESLG